MPSTTILVLDDERQIRRVVRRALEDTETRVVEAATGQEGIDIAAARRPDLIVLDLGLPGIPGVDVCREIRGWSTAPIVVLSARHSDQEKATLLDLGADDYVTKPFSTIEFQARVRAQLRRARLAQQPDGHSRIDAGDLTIDLAKRSVSRAGEPIHLTPIEWELLRALATNAGRTMTHQQLFGTVWTRSHGDAQQYLRVHVASLRRKLESDPVRPCLIITEPGVGYRFEAVVANNNIKLRLPIEAAAVFVFQAPPSGHHPLLNSQRQAVARERCESAERRKRVRRLTYRKRATSFTRSAAGECA